MNILDRLLKTEAPVCRHQTACSLRNLERFGEMRRQWRRSCVNPDMASVIIHDFLLRAFSDWNTLCFNPCAAFVLWKKHGFSAHWRRRRPISRPPGRSSFSKALHSDTCLNNYIYIFIERQEDTRLECNYRQHYQRHDKYWRYRKKTIRIPVQQNRGRGKKSTSRIVQQGDISLKPICRTTGKEIRTNGKSDQPVVKKQ